MILEVKLTMCFLSFPYWTIYLFYLNRNGCGKCWKTTH